MVGVLYICHMAHFTPAGWHIFSVFVLLILYIWEARLTLKSRGSEVASKGLVIWCAPATLTSSVYVVSLRGLNLSLTDLECARAFQDVDCSLLARW